MLREEGAELVIGRTLVVYGTTRRDDPQLRVAAADSWSGILVGVSDAAGKSRAQDRWVSNFPPQGRPDAVWCGDLNGDGILDFLLPLSGRGNGLGALFFQLVVALSSQAAYRVWVVPAMAPEMEDVLRVGTQCVMVKATFVSNQEERESRRHSCWVYNLIAIRQDRLVAANALDRRFPKWVWFTAHQSPSTNPRLHQSPIINPQSPPQVTTDRDMSGA